MTDSSGDPLFQLNTVLWLLQPLPNRVGALRPLLHDAGYRVRALGKSLTASADVERLLATELDLRGAPAPDVLASAPDAQSWPVFECKASSFGSESSTSQQATKILARATDLSLVAGSPPAVAVPGCVAYVTRRDQVDDLQATLDALAEVLRSVGLTPAASSTIGMSVETGVGVVVGPVAGELPGPAGEALSEPVTVLEAAGTDEDARPLYLVPFDPSIEQSEEERNACLRILLARARAQAASSIGRSPAPGNTVLEGHDLLDSATFGLSKLWRDNKSRDAASHEVLKFVKAALGSLRGHSAPFVIEGNGPRRIEIHLKSEEQRQECAEAVLAMPLPGEVHLPDIIEEQLPFADQAPRGH